MLFINRLAAQFFEFQLLQTPAGKPARDYLQARHLHADTIADHRLGFAPPGWNQLTNYLARKRVPASLAVEAGLIQARKNGQGYYDRFRNRIIFSIIDGSGQIIGFGGRVMDDSLPKYINSPESTIYHKGRSLYGMFKARSPARRQQAVFVVEGYLDMLMMYQHGFANCVATLGTALTAEHARLLRGILGKAGTVTLVFDSDQAGLNAAQRSISVFDSEHVSANILVLPAGYDPDDFLSRHGPDEFMARARQSRDAIRFLIDSALQRHGRSADSRRRVVAELQGPLAAVSDELSRALYVRELAEQLGVDERIVLNQIDRARALRPHSSAAPAKGSAQPPGPTDRFEKQVLAVMIMHPVIATQVQDRHLLDFFENQFLKSVGRQILAAVSAGAFEVDLFIDQLDAPAQRMVTELLVGQDDRSQDSALQLLDQFEKSRRRHQKLLLREIRAAEAANDLERLSRLLEQKQQLTQRTIKPI